MIRLTSSSSSSSSPLYRLQNQILIDYCSSHYYHHRNNQIYCYSTSSSTSGSSSKWSKNEQKKKNNLLLLQQSLKSLEKTNQLKQTVKLYKENKLKEELKNKLEHQLQGGKDQSKSSATTTCCPNCQTIKQSVTNQHLDCFKSLIVKNEASQSRGDTLLHAAVEYRSLPLVEKILNDPKMAQSTINQPNLHGFFPIHFVATSMKNELDDIGDAIETLERKLKLMGMKPTESQLVECQKRAGFGDTFKILDLLLSKGANIESMTTNGSTLFAMASSMQMISLCQHLIRRGAVVDAENGEGDTPLTAAIKEFQMEMIMFLVEIGKANVNRVSQRTMETPLTVAATRDFATAIEYLSTKGAHDQKGSNFTSLHVAASQENLGLCKILLRIWPELVNYQDVDGTTPIFLPAQMGNYDQVSFFIEKGAIIDHTIRTMDGDSLTMVCAQTMSKEHFEAILEKSKCRVDKEMNKMLEKSIHLAAKAGNTRLLEYLVREKNCSVNDRNRMGETPLMLAVANRKISTVRELVRLGANVNQGDQTDKTPLHIAAEIGLPKIITILLEAGANPKLQTRSPSNKTPLQLAIDNNNQNVISLLNKF